MFKKISVLALTLAVSLDSICVFAARPKTTRKPTQKRFAAMSKIKKVEAPAPVVEEVAAPVAPVVEQPAVVAPAPVEPVPTTVTSNTTINNYHTNDLATIKQAVREELEAQNQINTTETLARTASNSEEIKTAKNNLATKIEETRMACSDIKHNLDTIFGLSVATTVSSGLGTVAAGSALAVGIVKSVKDKKADETAIANKDRDFGAEFENWKSDVDAISDEWNDSHEVYSYEEMIEIAQKVQELSSDVNQKNKDLDKALKASDGVLKKIEALDAKAEDSENEEDDGKNNSIVEAPRAELEKSITVALENIAQIDEAKYKDEASKVGDTKVLGHVRTGLLAGATATSAVSTGTSIGASVTAAKLAEKMSACNIKLAELRVAKSALEAELEDDAEKPVSIATADNILASCTGFDENNIKTLKTTMTVSAVVSGVGTAAAGTGTVTSIMANTDKVRSDNSEKGKKKEKTLNLISNIAAGVTTGTSATSTVLSATAIAKAKKDSEMAERCESALAQ